MMRLVISPRHHHLGRQQGFHDAISKSQINWTSCRCSMDNLRKHNEPELSTLVFTDQHHISLTSSKKKCGKQKIPCSIPMQLSSSPKSYSPLLPPHNILSSQCGMLVQTTKSLSSSSSPRLLEPPPDTNTRLGGTKQRIQLGKMSILNTRLDSSSSLFVPIPILSFYRNFSSSSLSTPSYLPGKDNSKVFNISEEVSQALADNKPVLALESAIITHGMPFPDNIDTAFRLESIIRELDVTPVTIGVINGCIKVGLSSDEIQRLGESAKHQETRNPIDGSTSPVVKVSRRDIPFAISNKLCGGTTVAGTIIAAVKAGIPVFATGGLGGVHRGAETTFDVSADLKELGRNPIAVVSAGVKSILDIGKTLEYMETEGICVAVLSPIDQERKQIENGEVEETSSAGKSLHEQIGCVKFPSFFTAQSQFPAPYRVLNETEAAALIYSALQFKLNSGILVAVPIPKQHEGAGRLIEDAIKVALEEAAKRSIQGKDMTPFLLSQVNRLTSGESLKANKHLIENNVRAASKIATYLAQLSQHHQTRNNGGRIGMEDKRKSNTSSSFASPYSSSLMASAGGQHQSRIFREDQVEFVGSIMGKGKSFPNGTHQCPNDQNTRSRSNDNVTPVFDSTSPIVNPAGKTIPSNPKHSRPVVIGGTSLDLVLAIQETEIVNSAFPIRRNPQSNPRSRKLSSISPQLQLRPPTLPKKLEIDN